MVAHRFHELFVGTAREIGSPDRTLEELVSTEKHTLALNMETTVARCVSRCVEHRELNIGKDERLSVMKIRERTRDCGTNEVVRCGSEQRPQLFTRMASHVNILGVQIRRDSTRRDAVNTSRVVDMSVCDKERDGREIVGSEKVPDPLGVRRSVNDHRGTTGPGSDDIGVRLEEPQGRGVDEHG